MSQDFGSALKQLREAKGLSRQGLASRIGYTYQYVWEQETGRKPPTAKFAKVCDHVLATGGALLALATGRTDVDRRTLLTSRLPASTTDASVTFYGWPETRVRHGESYVYTALGETKAAYAAQERALALYPDQLIVAPAQVKLHRSRGMIIDGDIRAASRMHNRPLPTCPQTAGQTAC
jgi:transcriptional regulator with XRE-family HTH domain